MVEDRITDGYRVAELLASEIDGRQTGPLGDLAVANADRSVTGSPDGERAYDVRHLESDRDPRREPTADDAGTLVAEVSVHEAGASVTVFVEADAAVETALESGLEVERDRDGPPAIVAAYGAQTKRVADALAAASAALGSADES